MEVKSIYVANILKTHEKLTSQIKNVQDGITDKLSISPESSKRLFGEIMEKTIKDSLSNEEIGENK